MKFTKMHGLGNDYIYVNCINVDVKDPAKIAKRISNRHFGVGSDGLVLILPSNIADFRMRMFNSDGSEAEMCGNAIRCVGKYVYDERLTNKLDIDIETLAGIKRLKMKVDNNQIVLVEVDMGEPETKPSNIPVITGEDIFLNNSISIGDKIFNITCISMGNPHAVIYVDNVDKFDVAGIGPKIETHELFPKKTNVEFVEKINSNTLKMRVWERGAGETMACGTGACAALVSSVLSKMTDREVTIKLLGGDLLIKWDESNNHVYMTGPAVKVFDGEIEL